MTKNFGTTIVTVRAATALCFAAFATMLSACVTAAVPVEESTSRSVVTNPVASPVASPGGDAPAAISTARLSELYYQLQTLQQEVQNLRGMAEEQAHQISRLRKDQKSQYLDLDRRMQGVAGATRAPVAATPKQPQLRNGELYVPAAGGAAGGATTGAAGGATNTGPTPAANSGAADVDERKAYGDAISLMKARQFDDSILAFNRLVVDYPGGSYNGHAFYWLGELYLTKKNNAKARQQFVQVIDLYPGHTKVPDALYKIGVIYHAQGDNDRALQYLNRVRGEFANSNAAKLAADYAKEMQ